jgi:hypothetical protein
VIAAASRAGDIDDVVHWAGYDLDPSGDVFELLCVSVEHIAHTLLEALRLSPNEQFFRPVGSTAESDARIVAVCPVAETGKHRITVVAPTQFAGYWVEFDRETPPSALLLQEPDDPGHGDALAPTSL